MPLPTDGGRLLAEVNALTTVDAEALATKIQGDLATEHDHWQAATIIRVWNHLRISRSLDGK